MTGTAVAAGTSATGRRPSAGARAALVLAGAALVVGAVVLTLTGESPQGWQVLLAVVGAAAALLAAFVRGALVVAAFAVVTAAGLSLVDTDPSLIGTSLAGIVAFGAFEAVSLARMWRSVGVLERDAEHLHARGIVLRTGIGGAAAGVCTIAGLVQLPAPGVIAAVGVLAAAAVIIGSALRTVGADAVAPGNATDPGGVADR